MILVGNHIWWRPGAPPYRARVSPPPDVVLWSVPAFVRDRLFGSFAPCTERPVYGLAMIRPWLAHVHVKNARPFVAGADGRRCLRYGHRWCGLREGIVDWTAQVAALRGVGYEGYLSLEDFNPDTQADEKLDDFADLFTGILQSG